MVQQQHEPVLLPRVARWPSLALDEPRCRLELVVNEGLAFWPHLDPHVLVLEGAT
jgi:hypothetical protein